MFNLTLAKLSIMNHTFLKLHQLLILSIVLVSTLLTAQNTWVVSNDPSFGAADFDNIQEAVDSASTGDKIYVHGSVSQYASFTIDKKLHLIGSGRWKTENMILDENPNWTYVVGAINVASGSQHSIIEGFSFANVINIGIDSIIIRYNACLKIDFQSSPSYCLVYGNYFNSGEIPFNGSAIATIISNNIIVRGCCSDLLWSNNSNNLGCGFEFNSVHYPGGVFNLSLSNCIINNNIIDNSSAAFAYSNAGTPQNNLFATGNVTVDSTNLKNVDMTTVWNIADPSPDGKYRLIGDDMSNPAIGFANDGSDAGAFGGVAPYRLSGIVKVPTVYDMVIPLTGDTTNMLKVKIKAKSN